MTAAWEGGAKEQWAGEAGDRCAGTQGLRRGAGAADSRRDTWKCQDSPEAMNPSQRGGSLALQAGRQRKRVREGTKRTVPRGAQGYT